jgi:C4-dicarboxylate transporter DctM subunit
VALVITAVLLNARSGQERRERASFREIASSFLHALPALIMPVVVLGGIYSGMFTPTEAAAIAVAYVLAASAMFERGNFSFARIFESARSAVITTAVIFIILGGATVFANGLTFANVPQAFTQYMTTLPVNEHVTMGLILVIFLVLGTVLDPVPILYITIPIVFPVVLALGYDGMHFAILTIACMMVAQVTPPIGMSLFALSGAFRVPIGEVMRGALPYLYALLASLIVLWAIPPFSTLAN